MVDATYKAKVYRKQGGDELVVASGGKITVESGGTLDVAAGATMSLGDGIEAPADIALARGSIIRGVAGNVGGAHDAKTSGQILVGDGTDIVSVAVSGDATLAANGALTVVSIGGKKIARGVHQQAAAADTIATGLATVVACGATWRDTPTLKQLFLTATIGDQAGAPAAGSIIVKSFKPTAANDVTPTAATDFSDNLSLNWWAIGT